MNERIEYILADPEGNKTILVLTPVTADRYQEVTGRLLSECPEAEQVGFVKNDISDEGAELPYMEMSGLEFCGNATRAFAYYEAQLTDPPAEEITVRVSGCKEPLKAWINSTDHTARLQMPIPLSTKKIIIPPGGGDEEIRGDLVEMEGIAHLILTDIPAERDRFIRIRDYIFENEGAFPAFGVMFIALQEDRMTPVVYVRDVDTIYFEGSCASGTVAAAFARTSTACVPSRVHTFRQPAGTLKVRVDVEKGNVISMILDGGVELSGVIVSRQFKDLTDR